jgi:hypothetical protein
MWFALLVFVTSIVASAAYSCNCPAHKLTADRDSCQRAGACGCRPVHRFPKFIVGAIANPVYCGYCDMSLFVAVYGIDLVDLFGICSVHLGLVDIEGVKE